MTRGMFIFILFIIICFGLPLCFIICSHQTEKVPVKSQAHQPCYIRLDEEQFERLIENMKNK